MPDVPPPYLRFMKPMKTRWAPASNDPFATIDHETVIVRYHRMKGLSVPFAYWPDSWQDSWAIEELLKWEGREGEIRRDQYYGDLIIDENQQARENERRALESQSVSGIQSPVVLVVHESVHRRGVDSGADVLGRTEQDSVLRLERNVSGGHAADLSGEDGS